jgi:ADP-ribosyl-[dinitrogen reductase] hydrolase
MIGAIIGDIAGSIYEFDNIKTKDFELFGPHPTAKATNTTNGFSDTQCRFTDDTVLTVAVAEWLIDGDDGDLVKYFSKWYARCGGNRSYGGMFERWINQWERPPYNSYGNGSAMRVSATAWLAKDQEQALALAKASAEVSHSHPEGIKGAQATALAIWLARQAEDAASIKQAVEEFAEYDLSESVDEIREWYYFNETCQKTVPQAIICALEATDFEDAIKNGISIGGDSDTVGAITGSIAQAMFGVPDEIVEKARSYLSDDIIQVVDRFNERMEMEPD